MRMEPRWPSVRAPRTRSGLFVRALVNLSVLVMIVRLWIVNVDGELVVVASMVTVWLPALVMRLMMSLVDGANARDQLVLVSHLLLPSVQLLVPVGTGLQSVTWADGSQVSPASQ